MNTFIIEIDKVDGEAARSLIGFFLSTGLNFRKLNRIKESSLGKCLFVEVENKTEKAIVENLLKNNHINNFSIIDNHDFSVNCNSEKIGTFKIVNTDYMFEDSSSGKKFSIVK